MVSACHPLSCECGPRCYCPQRYILAITCLTGLIIGYGHRVSLSIAITTMTNKTESQSKSCPAKNTSKTHEYVSGGIISWSNSQQNSILGSFYPGYFIGHLPAGIFSDKVGGRYVFFSGMALSTLSTLLTPIIVVHTPWYMTMVLRNIMGLGQSVIFPAISSLYARWIPAKERSFLGAFSFAAGSVGIVVGNSLTGLVIHYTKNWPAGFYLWGGMGIVWCFFCLLYVYSEPDSHPYITEKEKTQLTHEIHHVEHHMKIPWKGFLSDIAVWAILVCQIGHDFTLFTLVNNFPKYMSDVLKTDLNENSLTCSIPYLCQWFGGLIAGKISDYLIDKKGADVLWSRRTLTLIGMIAPGALIVGAGFMGCDSTMVIVLFTLNLLTKGPFFASMKINHLDLSVNFPGIIMALVNGIGALAGWVSPMLINMLAPNNTLEEWLLIYWIVFGVATVAAIFYVIFSAATRRIWDVPAHEMDEYLAEKAEAAAAKQKKKDEKAAKKAEKAAKKADKAAKEKAKHDAGPST